MEELPGALASNTDGTAVLSAFYSQVLKLGGLEQTDWPTVVKTQSLQSRRCQGYILSETLGEGPLLASFQLLAACQQSLAFCGL